jgi:hypothetical protein
MFAKRLKIGDRPKCPANQPLDFQRSSALFAARRLTVGTRMR